MIETTLHEIYVRHLPPSGDYGTFGGDKGTLHSYIDVYSNLFGGLRHTATSVLEIGVQCGHSLRMWRDYFTQAKIYGIDIDARCLKHQETRIEIFILDSADTLKNFSDLNFDIIVDDGSHQIADQQRTFNNFFPKLKEGGIYVIEDVPSLDQNHATIQSFHSKLEILDRRYLKGRTDDVLAIVRK